MYVLYNIIIYLIDKFSIQYINFLIWLIKNGKLIIRLFYFEEYAIIAELDLDIAVRIFNLIKSSIKIVVNSIGNLSLLIILIYAIWLNLITSIKLLIDKFKEYYFKWRFNFKPHYFNQ